jgi:purine-nucleoside phosphorylase
MFEKIKETTEFLKQKVGSFVPQYGIVLGTGLGKLADVDIPVQSEP